MTNLNHTTETGRIKATPSRNPMTGAWGWDSVVGAWGRASVAGALLGLFALTALSFSAAEAQEEERSPRWSVGTSLTFPMVGIYQLHFSYAVGDKHEVLFGPCFQNYRHTSFTARAYTLLLGYRYYVWRGLHVEAELYPAYNNLRSHVTGSNYPGVELWSEIKIGYRFNLNDRWYIQPAPGIGFGIFQSNPPPGFWDEIETPIFVPQLILGFRL